ncbi:DUF1559 domain-containing protein [Blastopirellula sp. JC732]|uniref:DUF1559 domain-containing protein n=1 Tax=Blastopirellula sediminis TaxID=2894196 RepID=A0A9X1SH73_9BACT|nr:DUF1559 domain-containing protein [Blastopirellula sediminis]MCC9629787.1 DUF1559 domain-containing protein [Blastopirellula sediminis]
MLELLVVIAILILLLMLLLPAGGHSIEASRRMNCSNNLKQLALAIHNYHDTFRSFPAAIGGTKLPDDPMASNVGRLSGMVDLLPFLEQRNLHDQIRQPYSDSGKEFPAMGPAPWIADYPPWKLELDLLHCRSAERKEKNELGQTNYAFCIGDRTRNLHTSRVDLPQDTRRGVFGADRTIRFQNITDGTSNTIMLGEIGNREKTLIVGQYVTMSSGRLLENPSRSAQFRLRDNSPYYADKFTLSDFGRGGRWADGSAGDSQFNTILPPNSPSCVVAAKEAGDGLYSLSGFHIKGAQVALADGSVRFIPEDIDCGDLTLPTPTQEELSQIGFESPYGVWGALGTANGGEVIGEY